MWDEELNVKKIMAASFAVIKKASTGLEPLTFAIRFTVFTFNFSIPQFNYMIFIYALFHSKKLVFQAFL